MLRFEASSGSVVQVGKNFSAVGSDVAWEWTGAPPTGMALRCGEGVQGHWLTGNGTYNSQ